MERKRVTTTHPLQRTAVVLHRVGTPWFFFVAVTIGALALYSFSSAETVLIFILGFLITIGSVGLLKILVRTPRPEGAYEEINSYAFPSGHAAGAFFLAVYVSHFALLLLSPILAWTLTTLSFTVATLVGVSRVILSVHTHLQVIVGVGIGTVVPLVALLYENTISYFLTGLIG